MDEGLLKLLDQLDSLMNLREKSAASYAPASEGRLLDLSINALKMAVQANMEARDRGLAGLPETYRDLILDLAASPDRRPEILATMRDNTHVHDRYLRDRARHLMGLSHANEAGLKRGEASQERNLSQGKSAGRAIHARQGRLVGQRHSNLAIDREKPDNAQSRQIQQDFGAEKD